MKKKIIKKDNEIKRYEQEIQELKKQLNDYKKTEEEKIYGNIPYLETEEEAAENIADIDEQKDNKARTFAPTRNVDENTRKKDNFDDIKDDIEDFGFDDKKKSNFNEHGININGLDKDGLDKDGYNIYGIKGTRKKYPNRKINWINDVFCMINMDLIKRDLIKMVIIYMDLIKID